MPVAITRKMWEEYFTTGLQALDTGITLILEASSFESAQRAFQWAFGEVHDCAGGEGGCLDDKGKCIWWPSDPQELCGIEALEEYAEEETSAANRRKLLAIVSGLQELINSSNELPHYDIGDMELYVYKTAVISILTANISLIEQVYGIGRPANSKPKPR